MYTRLDTFKVYLRKSGKSSTTVFLEQPMENLVVVIVINCCTIEFFFVFSKIVKSWRPRRVARTKTDEEHRDVTYIFSAFNPKSRFLGLLATFCPNPLLCGNMSFSLLQ